MARQKKASSLQPDELLVKAILANPQKGLTISHTTMESIIGISYRLPCGCLNSRYSYYISKANKKLTAMSLRIDTIAGYGYRILQDNQYADVMRKLYNTGVKYIEKAKDIGDNTDVTTMKPKEYKEWENAFKKVDDACSNLTKFSVKVKKNIP